MHVHISPSYAASHFIEMQFGEVGVHIIEERVFRELALYIYDAGIDLLVAPSPLKKLKVELGPLIRSGTLSKSS